MCWTRFEPLVISYYDEATGRDVEYGVMDGNIGSVFALEAGLAVFAI